MKFIDVWSTILWLGVFSATFHNAMSGSEILLVEERPLVGTVGRYKEAANKFVSGIHKAHPNLLDQNEKRIKNNIPRFTHHTLKGIGKVSRVPKGLSTKQKIKAIGDAIVPIIQWGLMLIGPKGAVIGGFVSAIWGWLTPIFGKSAFEEMIDDMKAEIDDIRKYLKRIEDELPIALRKSRDAKLREIVSKGIQGEIERNEYICNKYAVISRKVSAALNKSQTINETLRFEAIVYMNDCDNFLKDSAGAYLFTDYAEILWLPAVTTTLVRVSFLTEVCNRGPYLKLQEEIVEKYWAELKYDLKQLFDFYGSAVVNRLRGFVGWNRTRASVSFTESEFDTCKIQAQLLYFDREIYTYGVPQFIPVNDSDTEIKVADYKVSEKDDARVIQVYFNEKAQCDDVNYLTVLNCISGQAVIHGVPMRQLTFRVTFFPNKSYQLRILYFIRKSVLTQNSKMDDVITLTKEASTDDRNVVAYFEEGNIIRVNITKGEPSNTSLVRFVIPIALHVLNCDPMGPNENGQNGTKCASAQKAFAGKYVIENVCAFNIFPGNLSGKIVIERAYDTDSEELGDTFILGAELIVLPVITGV